MENELVNRVASSGLVTLNLEEHFPAGEVVAFDLKDHLFMGLILKEKDFREAMKTIDWSQFEGKNLCVFCSADAIIPMWAFMLVAVAAAPFAADVFQGEPRDFVKNHLSKSLARLDATEFLGKRVVVKGCSDREVPASAYLDVARILQPITASIMYGEPCSTVPIFKAKKAATASVSD